MNSYLSYEARRTKLLDMVSKGRLLSLAQAANYFNCSKETITRTLNHLRQEKGHHISYSRSLKKFVLRDPT
nr:DeoR family transcriptional regulator [Pseudopedobacter sp.]